MNKKRNVSIVTVSVTAQEGNVPLFEEVIEFMHGQEVRQHKIEEFKTITSTDAYHIGFVETTQDKDIPPIKNKRTKKFSSVNINVSTEGLAFANIYLYDHNMHVLIYEINRNGCGLEKFKEILEDRWMEEHEGQQIVIDFSVVLRKSEYERMIRMNSYHSVVIDIAEPAELLRGLRQNEDSLENNLLRSQLTAAAKNRVNSIKIEYKGIGARIDPRGIGREHVVKFIDIFNRLCGFGYRQQIRSVKVKGYATNPEEDHPRQTTIDLLADTFNETFNISDIQIQNSLQQGERVNGITTLYQRIFPELHVIFG